MSANIGQDDIDKLLSDALGGISGSANSNAQSQDDIDALIAAADSNAATSGAAATAPSPKKSAPAASNNAPQGQSDIDALLAAAGDNAPQGQSDIDALLAAASAENSSPAASDNAPQGQSDIDALLAAASAESSSPAASDNAPQGQSDIDALLAAASDNAPQGQSDIDALLAAASAENSSPAASDNAPQGQSDIDALLAAASAESSSPAASDNAPQGQSDIDALLAEASAAPTPQLPPVSPVASVPTAVEEPADLLSAASAEIAAAIPASSPAAPVAVIPTVAPRIAPVAPAPAPQLSADRIAALQESLSLAGSSGEVESISGQIAELLGQLSERSRRYQAAYLTADQQTRELRYLITLNEQKLHSLAAEKESVSQEADAIRRQFSRSEGEKLAASEAHRTEIAALQLRIREQESRNQMLVSETNALKEEIERARNAATGADLEGRRARFDAERLTGELSSERQERLRLARALENREKELQAMQSQAAGHASTLFLDELHRLVRRLESELDVRGRAAQEALSVYDRMEFSPEMQLYAVTLRSALCSAAGLTPDESDALKALDVKEERLKSSPLAPADAPGEDSFAKALVRYDFAKASAIASALMRAGGQTPYDFMKEIYHQEALKHPEISAHLDELCSLLRGLKNLQDASDRSRGSENERSEKMLVMLFDLLHSLVRLKLVSRATSAIWEFFLELRGRFSFLTSDRQWQEYRERVLARRLSPVA